ncbi:MAG: tetratricopeptide repeat protein [Verrucomicrobiota bacterium]|nr:tetratricopeptide repeat protein [Verrucomicrobiota bacterium]
MLAFLITDLLNFDYYLSHPWLLLPFAFQIWMFVDAIRNQEYVWAILIFLFSIFSAAFYFFLVYSPRRAAMGGGTFEMPGSGDRKRIKELEGQIYHLDKAHHHLQLGEIYFRQGKLATAERCYRNALERDPEDPDIRAHLGECLLHEGRLEEARSFLERVVQENPRHDYGHSLMAYADLLTRLGNPNGAMQAWEQVLKDQTYAKARYSLAELYSQANRKDEAISLLNELIADEAHNASFQKRNDKAWVSKARSLLKKLT